MAPTPVTVAAAHPAPVFLDRDRTVEKAVGMRPRIPAPVEAVAS